MSVESFHQHNLARQRDWPGSMLATSTHDTKRSEDVRARMLAISELAQSWSRALPKWRTANRKYKKCLDEMEAPDANEEWLLYQTLLGVWPIDAAGAALAEVDENFVARIQRYMGKALKEAKLNTSWIQPNESWDNAMAEFVAQILQPRRQNKFLPIFLPLAGAINSLAQTILKLTAPGVPDIYQGAELWDDSLVDPDNRRPVDYARRRKLLAEIQGVTAAELMHCWPDGRIKMWVTQKLLQLRRANAELFLEGNYEPLKFSGALAESALGFVRTREEQSLAVIVPRLSSRVGFPPVGEKWQDTAAAFPSKVSALRDVFSRSEIPLENSQLKLSEAMAELPFAVFCFWPPVSDAS